VKVLLLPFGSAGDVHPFVGLGMALQARGHRVVLVTGAYFEPLVRRAGLEYVEMGTLAEYDQAMNDPRLWHPFRGLEVVAEGVGLSLPRQYRSIVEHQEPGHTVLVAAGLSFAARIAQEKLGLPLVTVHLQPSVFRSVHAPPALQGMFFPPWLPHALKRFQFWLADTLVIDRLLAKPTNAFRAELGLPPVRHVFKDWWHSPDCTIGLFPEWYAPPPSDWPPQLRLTGFPLYDERGATDVPSELAAFLDGGPPPFVFTPGSAMRQGQAFFTAAAEACAQLGRRGLFLTRFPEQIPAQLPAGVRHFSFVPFSQVLPRAAAVVHHGGIGSAAQGLAAGIPQLLMPMSHDQPDNADRLQRLGVARALKPARFRGPAVAAALHELTTTPAVGQRCREMADRFRGVDALGATCKHIEEQLRPARAAV